MDASYIGWLAMGVGCVASAVFYTWLSRWVEEAIHFHNGTVEVTDNNHKITKGFDVDVFLDLACSRLDESALGLECLTAHPSIARSVFSLHRYDLLTKLERGAQINPHDTATLLQMHNQARFFGDGSGDIPDWVASNRWPTYEEQRDHLIEDLRRRQQKNLMAAVSDVQSEMTSTVKRKM
ncbi:hypothetical protein [Stenotrophomonas sp. S39]|uniref:hypothetical protein n=1 Tax=Stenotrophomonas sp. S39 TaxID=2767451 RepID=UPI00190CCE0D|nr:hypothetical protein [Stenotrophomonas sp. S39]MBK0052969.1 hypothetical protein [Stenotrophomonas sp. S39]